MSAPPFDLPPPAPVLLAQWGPWPPPPTCVAAAGRAAGGWGWRLGWAAALGAASGAGSDSPAQKSRKRHHRTASDADSSDSRHKRKHKKKKKHRHSASPDVKREKKKKKEEKECRCLRCDAHVVRMPEGALGCPRCPAGQPYVVHPPGHGPPSADDLPEFTGSVDDRTVFLGNCPDHLTVERVHRLLPGVERVDLCQRTASRLKNIGFIVFQDCTLAEAAIAQQFLNVDGYMVRLKRYEKGGPAVERAAAGAATAAAVACCFNCGGDHHLSNCPLPLSCTFCHKAGHTFHVCPRRRTAQRGLQLGITPAAPT